MWQEEDVIYDYFYCSYKYCYGDFLVFVQDLVRLYQYEEKVLLVECAVIKVVQGRVKSKDNEYVLKGLIQVKIIFFLLVIWGEVKYCVKNYQISGIIFYVGVIYSFFYDVVSKIIMVIFFGNVLQVVVYSLFWQG